MMASSFTHALRSVFLAVAIVIGIADLQALPLLLQTTPIESDGRSKFAIAIDRAPTPEEGRLALLTRQGRSAEVLDLSDLSTINGMAIEVDLSAFPLAPGQYKIDVVVETASGVLNMLGQVILKIALPDGTAATPDPYAFVFTPRLDLGMKAQIRERVTGGANPSAKPRYNDLTVQGGFETASVGEEWDLRTRVNIAGSSVRSEAVTFSSDGAKAAKLNVQDYLIDAGYREGRLQVGQISTATNPVLLTNVSNRGVSIAYRLPFGLELSGATQSAVNLAGTDNFLGIANRQASSNSFSAGYDFRSESPGSLRFDIAHFIGKQPATDAEGNTVSEQSRGLGYRFIWRNTAADLRSEFVYATSEHRAPKPEGGFAVSQGSAHTIELGYDPLKGYPALGSTLDVTTAARLEHSSPNFRSLGSSFVSNYQTTAQVLGLKLGSAQLQLQGIQRFDNVGADRNYLRNRVSAQLFNLNLPPDVLVSFIKLFLKANVKAAAPDTAAAPSASSPIAGADATAPAALPPAVTAAPPISPWIPSFSVSRNVYNGFGDRAFVPDGYTEADLPHVVSTNHALGFNWKFESVSFGWKTMLTGEKNLQLTEQLSSSRNRKQGFDIDWKASADISLGAGYDRGVGERLDDPALKLVAQLRGKASWKINATQDVSLDLNRSRDYDSLATKSNTSRRGQLQWSARHEIPVFGLTRKLPLQTYLRFIASDNYNWTTASINPLTPRTWALQVGGTLSLF